MSMSEEEFQKLITSVSVVITDEGKVSVWRNLFDAKRYAEETDSKLLEDVEIQQPSFWQKRDAAQ